MDADDAVDALGGHRERGSETAADVHDDDESSEDIRLIKSFDSDEIGSIMTTNYVSIPETYTIKEAMRSVVRQAHENDNINTIYIEDSHGKYAGAMELKDLIIARDYVPLESIVSKSYPSVRATAKISDKIEQLKDYAEDSIPVLNDDDEIIGAITADDLIEAVDDEMGDDYAKLAGLTAEKDLHETLFQSMKKRYAMAGFTAWPRTGRFQCGQHFRGNRRSGGDRHVLPVFDPGYGRQCRHTVTGCHNSCADG